MDGPPLEPKVRFHSVAPRESLFPVGLMGGWLETIKIGPVKATRSAYADRTALPFFLFKSGGRKQGSMGGHFGGLPRRGVLTPPGVKISLLHRFQGSQTPPQAPPGPLAQGD